MLIDWFTVGAQALNFVILVWLMKRFLYKPILSAIAAREQRIAAEVADADARQAEARNERDELRRKHEEFDQQRAALVSKAREEAQAERQRLLDAARKDAEALRAKRQEALNDEQQSLNEEIARRTQQEVFGIARRTLTDLAGASLEERMSDVFANRLRELDGEAKQRLAKALQTARDPALVRSTYDLPPQQRTVVQQAINETFAAEIPVRFETAPSVISGIELTANGCKVAWSIADYLASLEQAIGELLKKHSTRETDSVATPQTGMKPAALEGAP